MAEPQAPRVAWRYGDVLTDLREAYDNDAEHRESFSQNKASWRISERAAFLERLRHDGGRSLVEIGAGTGQDALFFKEQGLEVLAIDLSRRNVEHCLAKGVSARVAHFLDLRLADESFDSAYSFNSLLHVPNVDIALAIDSVRRVVRRGGLVFIGTWGGRSYQGHLPDETLVPPRFFALRTDDEWRALIAPTFELVDFHTIPGTREPDFYFQSLTLRRPM